MKNRLQKLIMVAGVSTVGVLAGCGGGGGSEPATGTMSVAMTDAPACGYDEVNVTVSKVRVHRSENSGENESGWSEITLAQPRKINLLELTNGLLEELGEVELEAGRYTQLRLVLERNTGSTPFANSVKPTGGAETALATPSAVQSGIKLIHPFEVKADKEVALTLDFDACKSIVTQGNGSYSLKPVISVITMATSGGVTGYIDPALVANKPVVSAQVNGVVIKSTVPESNGSTVGKFTLSPMPAGDYTIVLTADGRATSVINGVPVVAQGTTTVSSTSAPILLSTSGSNVASGAVDPADAGAEVLATQSFASGPTVTVKYQNADLTTGAYSLSLPTAAPQFGQYGSGSLPISFAAQTAAAGRYSLTAAASGYKSQTVAIDVASASAVRNFALLP